MHLEGSLRNHENQTFRLDFIGSTDWQPWAVTVAWEKPPGTSMKIRMSTKHGQQNPWRTFFLKELMDGECLDASGNAPELREHQGFTIPGYPKNFRVISPFSNNPP
jgi:hypothetical protein